MIMHKIKFLRENYSQNYNEIQCISNPPKYKITDFISQSTIFIYIGTDQSGECSMTTHEVVVDTTYPVSGKLTCGPVYDMVRMKNNTFVFYGRISLS